jgi:hypothetical protein
VLLIIVPVAIVAAVGPREWFVNWPTMFGIVFLLVALLCGAALEHSLCWQEDR